MKNYENPAYQGNSAQWHTGKKCVEVGCHRPAGTRWSPLWCFPCNVVRMNRISASLERLASPQISAQEKP